MLGRLHHGIEGLHDRLRLIRRDGKSVLTGLDGKLGQRFDVVPGDAHDRRAKRLEVSRRIGEIVCFDRTALGVGRREKVENDRSLA
jgi:hypothetical protein